MIKAIAALSNGTTLLVVGLSHLNLDRLRAEYPIHIKGADVGIPAVELLIFAGETEASMIEELSDLIGATTRVTTSERLKN